MGKLFRVRFLPAKFFGGSIKLKISGSVKSQIIWAAVLMKNVRCDWINRIAAK